MFRRILLIKVFRIAPFETNRFKPFESIISHTSLRKCKRVISCYALTIQTPDSEYAVDIITFFPFCMFRYSC